MPARPASALPAGEGHPANPGQGDGFIIATPPVAGLQIRLLGPPRVTWEGRHLDIPRQQARALLFRLAATSQPIPREHLSFLFWPDIPEAVASRRLTRLLTHLRRALPVPGILSVEQKLFGLDPRSVWSDVWAFAKYSSIHQQNGSVDSLRSAADLYRGSFLAGFTLLDCGEFEAWILQQRSTFERLYLEALEILIEERAAAGAHSEAIQYARRYLEIDDLAETVHRRLIELYALVGDRSAALQQYERCAVVLERELGVSPLPETQAAYQAVLRGELAAWQPILPPAWTTLPSLHAPLVGRDEALSQLGLALARVRSGHGQMVLIAGEPGIGKSRLLQEFAAICQDQARVVVGSGHEAAKGLPYGPLLEALQPYASGLFRLAPAIEKPLAHLWPEQASFAAYALAAARVEPHQEQGLFFHALADAILRLAHQQPPLILCLDDLHWADETTLRWLGYVSRRLIAAPILVVATYRSEEASAVAALRTQLARLGALQEIRLEGLRQADVLHLIRSLSGQSSGAERFSQRLHRETGGNPFFVLETLRTMFEAGVLWQHETGWSTELDETTEDYRELPLPDTVHQAIQERLGRMSLQAGQVLEAGAILGHQFDLDLIYSTSGRSEDEVVEALEMLLGRQILSAQGSLYRFNHDLMRTAVLLDLSYGRRRLLHRRAAEALAVQRPGDLPALVRHFEGAEDPHRAAMYALRAGQNARIAFGYVEARAWLDRALVLLDLEAVHLFEPEAISANRRLRFHVLDERGWAHRLVGDMVAYARDSKEAAGLARSLQDPHLLAQVSWREARAQRWYCRYAGAVGSADLGLHASRQIQDVYLEALCLREIGLAARETGDYGRAQTALEQALDLFVSQGEVVYELHVLGNLSTLWCVQGEQRRAMALAQRALARCHELDLQLERRLPLGDMGAAAVVQGDAALARQCLLESLDIARRVSDRTQEILCLGHLGWLAMQQQMPAQALERLAAALDVAVRIDSRAEQSWLHLGLAQAHRLANQPDQALTYAQRASELAQAYGRLPDQALAQRLVADLSTCT
jgi:DNA-binding SARP family transcriptional activator